MSDQQPTAVQLHCPSGSGVTVSVCGLAQKTLPAFGPQTSSSPLHTPGPLPQETLHRPEPQVVTAFWHAFTPAQTTSHEVSTHAIVALRQPLFAWQWTRQSQPLGHTIAAPSQAPMLAQSMMHVVPTQPPVHSAGHSVPVGG